MPLDLLALALCFGGIVLFIMFALASQAIGGSSGSAAFFIFVVCEVAAIIAGLATLPSPRGKAAAIMAGVLLILSLFGLR